MPALPDITIVTDHDADGAVAHAPFGALRNEAGEHPQGHRWAFLAKRLTAGAG